MDSQAQMFKRDMLIRQRLHEQIAVRIEEMIATGQLQIDDRLPSEPNMAKQFGVHRSTVREALRLLQQRGLIRMKVGSGTYVSQVSPSVVAEMFGTFYFFSSDCSYHDLAILRGLLEPGIAALAALRAEQEDLERLEQSLHQMEEAWSSGDLDRMTAADAEFHLALVTASHNKLLVAIFSGIQHALKRELKAHQMRFPALHQERVQILRNHQALYAAVRAGDPERAREQMYVQIHSLFEGLDERDPIQDYLLRH